MGITPALGMSALLEPNVLDMDQGGGGRPSDPVMDKTISSVEILL